MCRVTLEDALLPTPACSGPHVAQKPFVARLTGSQSASTALRCSLLLPRRTAVDMQLLHIFLVGYLPIIAWTVALDQGSSKRHHHTSLDRRAGDDIKRSLWLERLTPDSDDSYAIGWALPIDVGPYFGDPDFPDNEGLKLNFDTGSSKVCVLYFASRR